MAVTHGTVELKAPTWLRDSWEWRATCGERSRFFLTERAAKRFIATHGDGDCELVSRSEHEKRESKEERTP